MTTEMTTTFELTWRAKNLVDGATTIQQMADVLAAEAAVLRELAAAGVELDGAVEFDYASLTTTDPAVAVKYGFEDTSEAQQ